MLKVFFHMDTSKPRLWDVNGNQVTGDLSTPLRFNLTAGAASYDPSATCKYWDEATESWSTRGVSTLFAFPADGVIACSTMHLSLFAIIVDAIASTLICSNAAAIFSMEVFESVLYATWMIRLPASSAQLGRGRDGGSPSLLAMRADRKHRAQMAELQQTLDTCALRQRIQGNLGQEL